MHLDLNTATKSQILTAAQIEPSLMNFLGGEKMIAERDVQCLLQLTETWFSKCNEAGAFYDENGF